MTTNRFLEFFLKLLSRYNRFSKQSFVRFLYGRTSRDFVARLTASRPKKLAPLAKKLVKLDTAVVSMVFQELCNLLAIFLDCRSSPCRSLLISKPTLCKTILSSWSRVRNRPGFFSSLEAFTSKIQGKTVSSRVSTILVDHDFCQIA